MKLISVAQAKTIDYETINKYGVPQSLLMEVAGKAVADVAFGGQNKTYVVVCGTGNNGGDGIVAARHLLSMGANVTLAYPVPNNSEQLKIAKDFGVPVAEDFISAIKGADVLIDAMVGIGLKGDLKDQFKKAIECINENTYVVSVDVPTGIDADTGAVNGTCVKADVTVTFGLIKTGLLLYPGRKFAGEIKIANIGFSKEAIDNLKIDTFAREDFIFPNTSVDAHKFKRGAVSVVAGCEKYQGAPYMAAVSALRTGCGIVTLYHPTKQNYTAICPELISVSCQSDCGVFAKESIPKIIEAIKKSSAVVLGCGLTVTEQTNELVIEIIKNYEGVLVLDADGINCITPDIFKQKKCEIIITPHIGEMAKLLGVTTKEVSDDMLGIAKTTANEYIINVVLKSASTVVATTSGDCYINTLGNCGMATAGSGDVLAGIIASLCAQGFSPKDSAVNGVLLHAKAGDLALKLKGSHYMNATDIIEQISTLDTKGSNNNDK